MGFHQIKKFLHIKGSDSKRRDSLQLGMVTQAYNPSHKEGHGRITIGGQLGQKVKRPTSKNKPHVVVHTCNSSYVAEVNVE
jgi:hypothetical protein